MDVGLGCPSIFVDMPLSASVVKMPLSPSPSKKRSTTRRIIKRFRSLGGLVSRPKPSSTPVGAEWTAKGKCGHVRPPLSTAHDLALMQFFAGGSMENNVRMLMAAGHMKEEE